ncbi:hypothetical protein [Caulobacter sp. Root1472]|uniref:DUF7146 domain-containing protein n=1 Tax=Caulobacter sp. Root1472 TaxID=1736470 RepID=UPI0007005340|nr:hypothetical protein [Caulobacter sp. Root1472]KQZ31713.1 hypothetical protein ASD47_15690 [Caulobacter sp. Root1472]
MIDNLFEEARDRVSIEERVEQTGVKLYGGKVQKRGICPLQSCGKKSGSRPFAVYPGDGRFKCWSCDKRGDVIELEQLLEGGTPVDAARRLLGLEVVERAPRPVITEADVDDDAARKLKMAQQMWDSSTAVLGSLAEKYLLSRCIHPAVVARAAPAMRYHPAARHSWDPKRETWVRAPALLVRPVTEEGPTGGVHATYLLRDGSGRDKTLGKRMIGPQTLNGRPGGAWLIGPSGEGLDGTPLMTGEGVETVLSLASLAQLQGRRARAAAALSLNRLQGGVRVDSDSCLDLNDPQAALEQPAFTWRAPEDQPWPEVVVGVDRDMKALKVWARNGRGRKTAMLLEGEARAALCGRLARQQWAAAGAERVRAALPPVNSDWNDELRRLVLADQARLGVSV